MDMVATALVSWARFMQCPRTEWGKYSRHSVTLMEILLYW